MTEIVGLAEQEAVTTIETHLAERTEGDPPAVQALLRFIDTKGSGLGDVRARIQDGLEAGRWPISVVAGAFVEVAYSSDDHVKILGFAEKGLLRLLPYETVRTYFDREEPIASEPALDAPINVNDVSVENRRQVALRHLRKMRRIDDKFARNNAIDDKGNGEALGAS